MLSCNASSSKRTQMNRQTSKGRSMDKRNQGCSKGLKSLSYLLKDVRTACGMNITAVWQS